MRTPPLGSFALGFMTLGCGQMLDTFEFGEDAGVDAGERADVREPDLGTNPSIYFRPADILVFVDSSISMEDEQESLALNFDRFVSQVAGVVDYRLGVVSMDASEIGLQVGTSHPIYAADFPHTFERVDLAECAPSGRAPGCIIEGARGIVDSANMTRAEQIERFRSVVRVGTCGSGQESGLGAMKLALENLGDGCNSPFVLRPEANLVLIFVTDEDEQADVQIEEAIDAVLAVKDAARVRIALVAGVVAGSPSNCSVSHRAQCGRSVCELEPVGSMQSCGESSGSCSPGEACAAWMQSCVHSDFQFFNQCHWCSYYNTPDCCSAIAGNRYVEFARRMEIEVTTADPRIPVADCVSLGTHVACLAESICTESFGDTLARIARELVIEELEL